MKSKKIIILIALVFSVLFMSTSVDAQSLTHMPIKPSPSVRISSPYGYRIHPITGIRSLHAGIDIAAPTGTYVYAYMDGVITMARGNGNAGNEIRIKHSNGLETRYLHMSKRAVNVGDEVRAGTIIGTVGSTGRVTGAHLHFEVRHNNKALNPTKVRIVRRGE